MSFAAHSSTTSTVTVRRRATTAFAGFFSLGACFLLAACSTETGTTPTCTQDETSNGHLVVDGGCNERALCVDDAGVAQSPLAFCCAGKQQLELAACLVGYGAVCDDANGTAVDPDSCCSGLKGNPATAADYVFCMHGFGAACSVGGMPAAAADCCAGKMGDELSSCCYAYAASSSLGAACGG